MAVISAPQSSITAGWSSTTRRLVMPAVSASVSRSRIIGIDTTQLANTSPANTPPTAVYTATNPQFCGLNSACSTPLVDGMPVSKKTANTTSEARPPQQSHHHQQQHKHAHAAQAAVPAGERLAQSGRKPRLEAAAGVVQPHRQKRAEQQAA